LRAFGAWRHRDALRAGGRHSGRILYRLHEGAPPPTISRDPVYCSADRHRRELWRARALHRAARRHKSQALAADALHFASDVLGSLAVIAGLALSGAGYAWGDAVAAIGVRVMIALLDCGWRAPP